MVIKSGAKMSKSLGNTVSPDEMVERYGADATRLYVLFAAPPDRDLDWQDAGINGTSTFVSRVYRFVMKHGATPVGPIPANLGPEARQLQRKLHQTIKRITDELNGRWHFNTCVSAIMTLLNDLYGAESAISKGAVPPALVAHLQRNLVLLLAPFAPYLAHELWQKMGEKGQLLRHPWPKFDPALAKEDEVEIAVQVNGKVRSRIVVSADAPEEQVRQAALTDAKVVAAMEGKQVVKAIVVPGKLVNIVVK
jgi:leucyl-tRNA synthetase